LRILFDHNVDQRFRRYLPPHEIRTTGEMRWHQLSNGILLQSASAAGFAAMICIDKNIEYQQNLTTIPLPTIILDTPTSALKSLIPLAPALLKLLDSPLRNVLYVIDPAGSVAEVSSPRPKR